MKQIQIPQKQTPTNYLVVRVELVHVMKGWFGLKDRQLTAISVVPNTPSQAVELTNRIGKLTEKYGKSIPIE